MAPNTHPTAVQPPSAAGRLPYRGLILDFVGVLTADVGAAHRGWCTDQGLDAGAWHRVLGTHPEIRRLYADLERGLITQAHWNRLTAPVLGVADHDNLMGRVWAAVGADQGMVALAKAARTAGYTVALLSNSFGLDPYNPYLALGVEDLFDVAVVSGHEGIAKPAPEIYRRTLARMGLTGGECVFVDDQRANLPPAEALGITTVLADGTDDTLTALASLLGITGSPAPAKG
ncbi:HAD family phosphatase [Streptacidiphilus sp. PB12-B1b]|uniref:HAD family hydrolase n=1 Tax=Streptacidiphilus sp. PB12-B1b TaxID=2705012 RepID=UPI0015FD24DB|nr:HAD family phosphatase [Streptacidiphilus sp. PB12-B1b]QMU76053.1 HAD family phosphatase [Streptacidiphilus sp. PB12-B1b]